MSAILITTALLVTAKSAVKSAAKEKTSKQIKSNEVYQKAKEELSEDLYTAYGESLRINSRRGGSSADDLERLFDQ